MCAASLRYDSPVMDLDSVSDLIHGHLQWPTVSDSEVVLFVAVVTMDKEQGID